MLTAWQYVVLVTPSDYSLISVLDMRARTASPLRPVAASPSELHCSSTRCFSLDIDQACLLTIEPMSGVATCIVKYDPAVWIGYAVQTRLLDFPLKSISH